MSRTASNLTDDLPPLILAGQRDAASRKRALAAAGELPDAILTLLDWDEDPEVRIAAAAARKKGDGDRDRVFARLALDPMTAAHSALRANPCMVPDYVLPHSRLWTDPDARAKVAQYSRAQVLLTELAHDSSPEVRRAAALNTELPDSQLRLLGQDRDQSVANVATEQIDRRNRDVLDRAAPGHHDRLGIDVARWSLAVHEVLNLSASSGDEFLASVARASLKLGESVASRVLRQPWVPAAVLRGLGTVNRQPDYVRKAVASNPNTPPEVLGLFAFGKWGTDEACLALANPSLETWLLEEFATNRLPRHHRVGDLEMAAAWSNRALPEALLVSAPKAPAARKGLARNRSAPSPVLSSLANDADISVRCAVAKNPATPASALVELAQNSSIMDLMWGIAASLVRNPATPRDVFESLLEHSEAQVRLLITMPSGYAPGHVLVRLANDPDVRVRVAAGRNPHTPQAAVDALREDKEVLEVDHTFDLDRNAGRWRPAHEAALTAPLSEPSSRAAAAAMLIRELDVDCRAELANHARPFWVLESEFIQQVLAQDPSPRVRAGIATHASEALRRTLADDADEDCAAYSVIFSVAYWTRDPALAADVVGRKQAWDGLVRNPVTPSHVLDEIFQKSGQSHSLDLAEHLNSPPSLLATLAETTSHSDAEIRIRLAKHPRTDPEVLASLAYDKTPAVRRSVAAHPSTPVTLLARLADDADSLVRAVVAMNPRTLPPTLEQLAADSDARVRQLVASNLNSPERVWILLAVDPDPTARALVHHHLTPSAESRRHLASQSETGRELVQVLAADADLNVRLAVARRADAPPILLDRLAEDHAWSVRRAARSTQRRARRQGSGRAR